jgi:diacylglycerol O-acyltransferase / wax synthase
MKLHHAIADGIAGVAAFGAFLDLTADAPTPAAPPWTPAPIPSTRELFDDNLRRRLQGLDRVVSKLAHPLDVARQARLGWPVVREAFAEQRAPPTSLNRPIGSRRRLAIIRSDLELVKEIAHTHGGKVNDVLLAAVSGGLRELLRSRGVTLGVGALSYAGQFNVTAVADRETCPDVPVFVDGARASLDTLARSVLAPTA